MIDVTTELAMEASDKAVEIARLKAENDRLREQIHWLKQGDILHVLTDQEYIDQCERERLMQVSIDALDKENAKLRELATYALKHIIEFECEVPDREMLRGKPCEDCADYGSSDCPKCMPRMFDVSGIEVDA